MQVIIKYFSVYFCFSPSVFRAFESITEHELGSWSSHGNKQRPANLYEQRLLTNQILIQPVPGPRTNRVACINVMEQS